MGVAVNLVVKATSTREEGRKAGENYRIFIIHFYFLAAFPHGLFSTGRKWSWGARNERGRGGEWYLRPRAIQPSSSVAAHGLCGGDAELFRVSEFFSLFFVPLRRSLNSFRNVWICLAASASVAVGCS